MRHESVNLIREFELQMIKESDITKEYSNKLLGIANKIKLLGNEFLDSRLVEKILVTVQRDIKHLYFVRKHKGSVYIYFDRNDTYLASTRAMKVDDRRS